MRTLLAYLLLCSVCLAEETTYPSDHAEMERLRSRVASLEFEIRGLKLDNAGLIRSLEQAKQWRKELRSELDLMRDKIYDYHAALRQFSRPRVRTVKGGR